MNLTIEEMRKIVDGAPEGSEMWRDMDSICSPGEVLYYWWFGGDLLVHDAEKGWVKSIYHDGNDYILDQLELLSDLKSEIDHHYYGRSEAEELAAYAELSQEKIEGGAMLVGDFSKARERIQSVFEDDRTDYVDFKVGGKVVFEAHFCDEHKGSGYGETTYCTMDKRVFEIDNYYLVSIDEIRHATPEEIAAGHRIDANTDYVTDIRNHISPMTIVQGDL